MDLLNAEAEDLLCDESFQRYCSGENNTDVAYWEAWINNNPDKQGVVARAKRLYDMLSLGQGNRLEQLAALKDAVTRRTLFKEQVLSKPETAQIVPVPVLKFRNNNLLKYAAAVLVLFTAGMLTYWKYGRQTMTKLYSYEYYTGLHDRKTIMLPDSSVIMLNENSYLSVSSDFDAHHRQVAITGEGFFQIRHDEKHPFLVKTTQYTIRVLGTTFNVRSYPGKDSTETTLLTGNIEIIEAPDSKVRSKVVLRPNEKFILHSADVQGPTGIAVISNGRVAKPVMDTVTHHLLETSWARRKIEIKDQSLGDIAQQLQAWYGIRIRFTDVAVKDYRYTATFNDETIFTALQYLQQSYPFAYTIEDDCIVITRS